MAYAITGRCIQCDGCQPQCPTGAIRLEQGSYWIDPALCNGCEGYHPEPQCVAYCPVDSAVPLQARKGRCQTPNRIPTSPDLFANGKHHSFASAIPIWEASNLLSQRNSLPWETDAEGKLCYQRSFQRGQSQIAFWLAETSYAETPTPLDAEPASELLDIIDLRAASLHLVYAAHATDLERPWEETFTISDRQIESYLGLEKRKDLNKLTKLLLMKEIAQAPCKVLAKIDWSPKGKVAGFSTGVSRLWHLSGLEHHFQTDELGCRHLVGFTLTIKAGAWSRYFLNRRGARERAAYYQYGHLPRSVLSTVTSIWQQHEGAARMLLWLLFKLKMGRDQRLTLPTLMRVAYGESKIARANAERETRKRLLRTFEGDLEVLNEYGLKPVFDPDTYPPDIQPLWARLAEIPDDGDAAIEFWTNDGNSESSLTDAAPRGKWNRLMHARLLGFELPETWERQSKERSVAQRSQTKTASRRSPSPTQPAALSGSQVAAARKSLKLSQRELAKQIGKSQSWVRDIENGRYTLNAKDREVLSKALKMD